jgi:hypothetical protein
VGLLVPGKSQPANEEETSGASTGRGARPRRKASIARHAWEGKRVLTHPQPCGSPRLVGMRARLVGTRARGAGEPHLQEAHVTEAHRATRNCRTRDPLERMARRRWLGGVGTKRGSRCRASPAPQPDLLGKWELPGPYVSTSQSQAWYARSRGPKGADVSATMATRATPEPGLDSRQGRRADRQGRHRGRAAVVAGGVTPTQGHGSRRDRAKGLSRSRRPESGRGWHEAAITLSVHAPSRQVK